MKLFSPSAFKNKSINESFSNSDESILIETGFGVSCSPELCDQVEEAISSLDLNLVKGELVENPTPSISYKGDLTEEDATALAEKLGLSKEEESQS